MATNMRQFAAHEDILADERVERRLAAILAADVAGYSRLIGADEEGTLARLRRIRHELVDPAIAAHRGRIVKTTGDGAGPFLLPQLRESMPSAARRVRAARRCSHCPTVGRRPAVRQPTASPKMSSLRCRVIRRCSSSLEIRAALESASNRPNSFSTRT